VLLEGKLKIPAQLKVEEMKVEEMKIIIRLLFYFILNRMSPKNHN
jgi:hypothetical protein